MTFIEALEKEEVWHKRCIIIGLYHNQKLLRNKRWTLRDTAKKLNISLGQVSENLTLMKAILSRPELENLTREQALEHLRTR